MLVFVSEAVPCSFSLVEVATLVHHWGLQALLERQGRVPADSWISLENERLPRTRSALCCVFLFHSHAWWSPTCRTTSEKLKWYNYLAVSLQGSEPSPCLCAFYGGFPYKLIRDLPSIPVAFLDSVERKGRWAVSKGALGCDLSVFPVKCLHCVYLYLYTPKSFYSSPVFAFIVVFTCPSCMYKRVHFLS